MFIARRSHSPTTAGSSALLLLWCASASAQAALTEEQFVERVLSSSPRAKAIEAEAQVARASAVGVGLWPNPSVEWERQPNPTEDRVAGGLHLVTASAPLVLSGRLGLEQRAARLGADAGEARRRRALSQLRRDALASFARVLAATRRTALLEVALKRLDELTAIIEVREKAGAAAGYDRLRIGLERAVVHDAVLEARAEARLASAAALTLLGGEALPALEGELGRPRERLPEAAGLEQRRADLLALALEAESGEALQRSGARAWVPEPKLTAGALVLERAQPGSQLGVIIGASVPLPLFDHGQAARARGDARRARAQAERDVQLHAARVGLRAALDGFAALKEHAEHHRAAVLAPARQLVTAASAGYRGGGAELLVVIDAERISRDAALKDIALGLELDVAWAELELVAGVHDEAGAAR